jgi:hypothetical protein
MVRAFFVVHAAAQSCTGTKQVRGFPHMGNPFTSREVNHWSSVLVVEFFERHRRIFAFQLIEQFVKGIEDASVSDSRVFRELDQNGRLFHFVPLC